MTHRLVSNEKLLKTAWREAEHSWAKMLAAVFQIDISVCDKCSGEMQVMAATTDPRETARYLRHVGIDPETPSRAPPGYVEEFFAEESFDAKHCYDGP